MAANADYSFYTLTTTAMGSDDVLHADFVQICRTLASPPTGDYMHTEKWKILSIISHPIAVGMRADNTVTVENGERLNASSLLCGDTKNLNVKDNAVELQRKIRAYSFSSVSRLWPV